MTRLSRCAAVLLLSLASAPLLSAICGASANGAEPDTGKVTQRGRRCPAEMALVGSVCVDRWEVHTVDRASGAELSPYYPPEPKLLRFVHDFWVLEASRVGTERARKFPLPALPEVQRGAFSPRAVSAPGHVPQGYFSSITARLACQNAGKRLCTEQEWVRACRSSGGTKHPYADAFEYGRCNVFRNMHPAYELHGNSSLGHLDPRLHLVWEEGTRPLLLATGQQATCASVTESDGAVYDMVGNLDEWIDDPAGVFVGGFYARATREGCEAKVTNHGPQYADYSLGTRCCQAAR